MTTAYFFETDSGLTGWIHADSIEQAREIFHHDYPYVREHRASILEPGDPEYPAS